MLSEPLALFLCIGDPIQPISGAT